MQAKLFKLFKLMRLRKSIDNDLSFSKKIGKDIHGFNFQKFIKYLIDEVEREEREREEEEGEEGESEVSGDGLDSDSMQDEIVTGDRNANLARITPESLDNAPKNENVK